MDMENSYIGMPNPIQQNYSDTCAIKSQQIILNQFGFDVTEDGLVDQATQEGIYNHGTSMEDVGKLLNDYGIQTHSVAGGDVNQLANELAQGHRVIVGVDSSELWHDNQVVSDFKDFFSGENPDHALIVAGLDTSDPDNIKVEVIDPGSGDYFKSYPLDQFMDAWHDSKCFMVSTDIAPGADTCPQMSNFDYDSGHLAMVGDTPWDDFQMNIPANDIDNIPDSTFVSSMTDDDNNVSDDTMKDFAQSGGEENEHDPLDYLTHGIGEFL